MDEVLGRSLLEAFAKVPDAPSAKGKRHPLPAVLTVAVAALRNVVLGILR